MFEVLMKLCGGLYIAAFVAIAWALVSKYRSTRDPGLLWLGVALVIWPLIRQVLGYGEQVMTDRLSSGQHVGVFPFSLVQQGRISLGTCMVLLSYLQNLVGSALVLVGILNLHKHVRRPESPVAAEQAHSQAS